MVVVKSRIVGGPAIVVLVVELLEVLVY